MNALTALTALLLQRTGLLLVAAFLLTRVRAFRHLLDRKVNVRTVLSYALIFGGFGIMEAQASVLLENGRMVPHGLVLKLAPGQFLVGPTLVSIVIAGLLGGPLVGVASGALCGVWMGMLGGDHVAANVLVQPLAGLVSGGLAWFFSAERVISPQKAVFIGMMAPILHMALLLVFTSHPMATSQLVNTIGLPLVVIDSLSVAVFTVMVRVVLTEQEQSAAKELQRALRITEKALPHLRRGLTEGTAVELARLLHDELKLAAVSITDATQVLAHVGMGDDHHHRGDPLETPLARALLATGDMQICVDARQMACPHPRCPLRAAILVPMRQSGEVVGMIQLYFQRAQHVRTVEVSLAYGLGQLLSNQLDAVAATRLKELVRDASLRNLQAQVQPHFLFNTLHMISSLIRINPDAARHLVVQLGRFMRLNLRASDHLLIDLREELEHLSIYVEIVKLRFSDQLSVSCHVDGPLDGVRIPPGTLQPLVENSIKHGLANVTAGGHISIRVSRRSEGVEIQIRDNGRGIPPALLEQLGKRPMTGADGGGRGLYNVNQRLIHLLGPGSALRFANTEEGCTVSFVIPAAEEGAVEVS
ncbi:histidine kinase [Alicyclobacillus contaminans]|uniref:histidine kinase n=1 Tax=Alicyclobacillus contaminans TaxID=392016 RepID=UPI00040AD9E0|nr:histidine kinase [Alicyclobacillus contaminans]